MTSLDHRKMMELISRLQMRGATERGAEVGLQEPGALQPPAAQAERQGPNHKKMMELISRLQMRGATERGAEVGYSPAAQAERRSNEADGALK